jgi:hypothetical protein
MAELPKDEPLVSLVFFINSLFKTGGASMKRLTIYTIWPALMLVAVFALYGITEGSDSNGNYNALLRGDYAFTQERTCVRSRNGFGENLELLGDASIKVSVSEGIQTYNGDGTGSVIFNSISIDPGRIFSGDVPFGIGEGTCDFTYEVNKDWSYTGDMVCSGNAQTSTGIHVNGQIAKGRKNLLWSDTNPNVETRDHEVHGIRYDICSRSGSAIKIRKDTYDYHYRDDND